MVIEPAEAAGASATGQKGLAFDDLVFGETRHCSFPLACVGRRWHGRGLVNVRAISARYFHPVGPADGRSIDPWGRFYG